MALVIADRVRETTTTTGTGAITLAGAYTSFQTFSAAIGNANSTYYTIASATSGQWEVGIGTYTSSGNTLSRDTILASSNSGSAVNFSSGTKDVFVTQPAERSLLVQSAGSGLFAGVAAFTANGIPYAGSTSTLSTGSGLTFDGTTLAASNISTGGSLTLSGGTANGVAYLNASKVLTTGSALTFDGTNIFSVTSSTYAVAKLFGGTGAGNGAYFALYAQGANAAYIGTDSGVTGGGTSNDLTLYPASTNNIRFYHSGSEQMRLTSTGLGIGTSSPSGKLHTVQSNGVNYFESPGISSIALQFVTNGTNRYRIGIPSGSTDLQFLAGGTTETMRLDSSGNLGLGVTPSAFSGGKAIEIGAAGNAFNGYEASNILISSGAYYNGGWKYANSLYGASLYQQYRGTHNWQIAASGTAGFPITFTQAMTLDASGNLGLGETNPAAYGGFVSKYAGIGLHANSTSGAAGLNLYENGTGRFSLRTLNGSAGLSFYDTFNGAERARIDSSGNLLVGTTSTTGNGNFTNAAGNSGALASVGTARAWTQINKVAASNNTTVDVWYGRDAAGNIFGNSFLVGHFYVYVRGASGANGFAGVYAIQTTGDGTAAATLTAVSSVTRGTSPVSSVQIANDGVNGAIKLTITYINNSGVVTGGESTVTFVGQSS